MSAPTRRGERQSTGPLLAANPFSRFATTMMSVSIPVLLAGTVFQVVPTEAGPWRGLTHPPTAIRLCLAILLGAVVAFALQRSSWKWVRLLLFGGLAALPLIPVVTGFGIALLFFQGPALTVVLSAVAAVLIVRAWRRREVPLRSWLMFVGALAFFLLLGTRLPGAAGPQGDEPHYLLMTESLVTDRDVDLANDFAERRYLSFYPGALEPHTAPRSPKGHIYTLHAPGLPALLAPGYALGASAGLGGYFGARVVLALLAATAVTLTCRLVADTFVQTTPARFVWLAFVVNAPFAFYAVSVYPEAPAALATAVFLLASRKDPTPAWVIAAGLGAAGLVWLHPKFLPLAAAGLFLTLVRRGSRFWRVLGTVIFLASVAGLLLYFRATFGVASISAAYGPGYADDVSLLRAPRGLLGFFIDRQYGLAFVAPFWLVALPGAVLLARSRLGDTLRAGMLAAAVLLVGASYSMWWGGACPPGRFVVPALPALAVLAAPIIEKRREVVAGLIGIGTAILALAAWAPRALHNRGDGQSALLHFLAPALDLDGALPSMVVAQPAAALFAVSLVAALALCWRGGWSVLLGIAGYSAVAVALSPGPLLEVPAATRQFLQTWSAPRWLTVDDPPPLSAMRLPLDLPEAPWVVNPGEMRYTRRFDLPPGTYKLIADLRSETVGGPSEAAVHMFAGETVLGEARWRTGGPSELTVGVGGEHRRLQVAVTGVSGRGRIVSLRVEPVALAR